MEIFLTYMFVIISCFTNIFCYTGDCKQGPRYWCQDDHTALECGAVAFCKFKRESSQEDKFVKFVPAATNGNTPPVNITLYYESLCPDCKDVWESQLFPTYQTLKDSGILHIDLVPYGNAQETPYGNQWLFYCQHGDNECIGNIIETCAIKLYPNQDQYIPFIHCLEYYGPTYTNIPYCASFSALDYARIQACAQGSDGNQYEHEMALKTDALNPPHQYVPWFTMNGLHDDTIQQQLTSNMLPYVCSVYTGTKPQACVQSNVKNLL